MVSSNNNNNGLMLALGRLEGKVDALISVQRSQDESIGRLEKRLRTLEGSRSWLLGAAAVLGAMSSQLMNWIGVQK
tara:strand:- start:497 stop:724 length:228 start_codon:yes stop_codon:yes gene_type:complete